MIQNCALIDLTTDEIINVVMADPEVDFVAEKQKLIPIPEGWGVDTTWTYNETFGFVSLEMEESLKEEDVSPAEEISA